MAAFDSLLHETVRNIMQFQSVMAHMTAAQTKAACLLFQPAIQATFGHLNENPLSVEFRGVRSMARLNPVFAGMAARFPDTMALQFGTGNPKGTHDGAVSRGFDTVTLKFNPTRPDLHYNAVGFLADLLSKDHERVELSDLLQPATIGGEEHELNIETALKGDFQDLTKISSTGSEPGKVVYLSAPMSGHFSTLVHGPVQNYLNAGYTVYLRDLKDASNVPLEKGKFGMEEQVRDVIDHLQHIHAEEGVRAQVSAICQGAIPVLIASAHLSEKQEDFRPSKLMVTSAPIDVEIAESPVNKFAKMMSPSSFTYDETTVVPFWKEGAGRRVRAGRSQVGGFKAGNPGTHLAGEFGIYNHIASGHSDWEKYQPLHQREILQALADDQLAPDGDKMLKAEKDFLNELLFRLEYHTEADHDAASYSDAGINNFLGNFLPNKTASYQDETIDLGAIDFPILTIDAANDNISAPGQTVALFKLTNPEIDSRSILVEGKGHFWWAGTTAKNVQWPQIFAWHEAEVVDGKITADFGSPVRDAYGNVQSATSIPEEYTPDILEKALEFHAAYEAREEIANKSGAPMDITITHGDQSRSILNPWAWMVPAA